MNGFEGHMGPTRIKREALVHMKREILGIKRIALRDTGGPSRIKREVFFDTIRDILEIHTFERHRKTIPNKKRGCA